MSTKRKNYAEKCIDIHDIESSLDRVMNDSKGSPVAVMKDGNPVFYCVPADNIIPAKAGIHCNKSS